MPRSSKNAVSKSSSLFPTDPVDNQSNSIQDKVLIEKVLSEGRYDGFIWRTSLKLTQRNYIKFYGNKRYENKYNKIELIGDKSGHSYIVNMSLDAFEWLIKTVIQEAEVNKKLVESIFDEKIPDPFTMAHFQDVNNGRYYFYYPINEYMSQIIYTDGFKAYGIGLSTLARNSILDVYSRMRYLLKWNNKTYQDKSELENFAESLYVDTIAKEIKALIKERCSGCQNETLEHDCMKQLEQRPDGSSLFTEVMSSGLADINFYKLMSAFANMMNISNDDKQKALEKRVDCFKDDKNRLYGLVWNQLEASKDPEKIDTYNFDGIFSFADMQ